jgi:hypothetical protein
VSRGARSRAFLKSFAAPRARKDSASRWRFHPPLPVAFRLGLAAFPVRPPEATSIYSRSVLAAPGTLRDREGPFKPAPGWLCAKSENFFGARPGADRRGRRRCLRPNSRPFAEPPRFVRTAPEHLVATAVREAGREALREGRTALIAPCSASSSGYTVGGPVRARRGRRAARRPARSPRPRRRRRAAQWSRGRPGTRREHRVSGGCVRRCRGVG